MDSDKNYNTFNLENQLSFPETSLTAKKNNFDVEQIDIQDFQLSTGDYKFISQFKDFTMKSYIEYSSTHIVDMKNVVIRGDWESQEQTDARK